MTVTFVKAFGHHAQHWVIHGKHVLISRADPATVGYEVLVFPADEFGTVTDSLEVWGCRYPGEFPEFREVAESAARFIC